MHIEAVRTFVTAADLGQFQEAAIDLGVTQQAVSKRITTLERHLGITLFTRTARGVQLTVDGQAFLPHARELLRVAARATESVQPGRRALRVDVTNRRIAPAAVLQDFHHAHPEIELDVVTLVDGDLSAAITAVREGAIDASFRAVTTPRAQLPDDVAATRAVDSRLEILLGPKHSLAGARELAPSQLSGHRIWIPGIVTGTEWATYYDDLAAAFGLTLDALGPHFGDEALMDQLVDSSDLTTLVGDRDRYLWPAHYDLRRIPLRDPTPIYPHSLIWQATNPHPALVALRSYLDATRRAPVPESSFWLPTWASA